jgi:fermentation-respiration switch protein FrsA (DUF1100 family)
VFLSLAFAAASASLAILAAGGIAAESALHPERRKAASVPPLVQNGEGSSVSTLAADGIRLEAWFFRPVTGWSGAAVIVFHGVSDWRGSMTGLASMLLQRGFAVLTPDLRGHGESGGICTYGVREAEDVQAWVSWLEDSAGARRIYGLGESLGGAVLIASLPKEKRLRAVVAECAYTSFPDIAEERTRRATWPGLRWVIPSFLEAGVASARLRHGVDLRTASPISAIRGASTPVLLIHGLDDNETAPENSIRLHAANPDATELWLVPGAAHTMAWSVARDEFERRVTQFFQSH